jgi:hypothetical protein
MHTYSLHAVDGENTLVREDAFDIISSPQGEVLERLVIASVLPPVSVEINLTNFLNNLTKPQNELNKPIFMERELRITAGLQQSELRDILCVIHEVKRDGTLAESLEVGQAVVGPTTFEAFMERADFPSIKAGVENFLKHHDHIWYIYKERAYVKNWVDGVTDSKILVSSMINLFNNTCSAFAHQRRIPTLRRTKNGLSFRVHKDAHFSSPLRKALNFVNLQNLYSVLATGELLFTQEYLESLGVTLSSQTTRP